MPLFRRFGRPGLLGLAARTAVVATTAGAITGAMRGNQRRKAQQAADVADYEAEQQQAALQAAAEHAVAAASPPLASLPPTSPPPGAGSPGIAELERLAALHAQGALTDAEFSAAKAKLLG